MTTTEQTISRSAATTTEQGEAGPAVHEAQVDVPDEVRERADEQMAEYRTRLLQATETYPHRLQEWKDRQDPQGPGPAPQSASQIVPQAGEPEIPGGYKYWDSLLAGPYQVVDTPPYRPGNIIAAGEWAFFIGVIWVNPHHSPGGGLPGTNFLADREYRACFETLNISDAVEGRELDVTDRFDSPADVLTLIPWFFRPTDPGPKPRILETHFAVDLTLSGMPFATLATWHLDPNAEPGFLFVPPVSAQLQHDLPARYLVYRK